MPTRARRERERKKREAEEAAQGAAAGAGAPISDGIDDPPPAPSRRRRGRPPGARTGATTAAKTQEIADALGKILVLPSFAMGFTGDPWAAEHFEQAGPAFADAIARHSETNPGLRRVLEKVTMGDANLTLIMAGVIYLLPPAMYFGVLPAPPLLKSQFGVPERGEVRQPSILDTMAAQQAAEQAAPGPEWVPPVDGEFTHPPGVVPGAHTV